MQKGKESGKREVLCVLYKDKGYQTSIEGVRKTERKRQKEIKRGNKRSFELRAIVATECFVDNRLILLTARQKKLNMHVCTADGIVITYI